MKYTQRRNSFSRFVPILLVIVITIVAVAAVIAIGRALFGKNDSGQADQNVNTGQVALLSTEEGSAVRLTVRGPIVANENFRSYSVVISPSSRDMTTYEGYLDKEINQKKLDNNVKAYAELVYALDKRKMMNGTQLTEQQNDLRGICASGKVYKFETLKDNSVVKSLWTSDCSGSKGSAQANVNEILDMFLKQIPDGKKMAAGIGLSQEEALFKL
ncbi:hypothetical protein TM7x_00305 [Candidatus Nanosynbacter lyticus]|jgi:hypothetical protein|uniref:Uncharacterized protein n=1 Tax=Candidatus Nanosynbacter lyticus TaxID=2093824 RepID=A0A6S4GVC0_9BACT|nr:hypothetical protein [Candidatus Nanosynbacter lyticus]AJA06697.1 hypothetical protein TM7x_00305 [Candidatus Nanosynbacter lyticus]QCT41229.1 hypothetical protein FBF38_00290 [TM7 phylum sp. oral taxon 952]